MLKGDLPESPLCSHRDLPSDHADSPHDLIAEPFREYSGPLPRGHTEFRALTEKLLDAGIEQLGSGELSGGKKCGTDIVRALQAMMDDQNRMLSLRAVCWLRLLGYESRSFEEIAREYGCTRASVNIIYRNLQKRHPGMRSRGDKDDAAREGCRRRRLGKRKPKSSWPALSIWNNLSPLQKAA